MTDRAALPALRSENDRKTKMLKILDDHMEKIKSYLDDMVDAPDGSIDEELLYWDLDAFGINLRNDLIVTFAEYAH